jgi:hypothetical protein
MNWLWVIYCWVWYHTEFWLTPLNRRPFTFMMRDFWAEHKLWGTIIFLTVTGLIVYACIWSLWLGIPLLAFHSMLFAHLWWGTKYIHGEQEDPQYFEEEDL